MDQLDLGKMYFLSQFCAATWQGEGLEAGQLCTLLRFKECNLWCDFCDTKALMLGPSISLTFSELHKAVIKTRHLLITGGEPLGVHRNACAVVALVTQLQKILGSHNVRVTIETNGTDCSAFHLAALVELHVPLVISWGLKYREKGLSATSKLSQDWDSFVHALTLAGVFKSKFVKVITKIVLPNPDGLEVFPEAVAALAAKDKIDVWAMPLGHTKELVLKNGKVALEAARRYGFNFSSRLHILHNFK
jgi:organic radical activating enzyme